MANGIAVFRPPEMMQVHRKFARVNVKWRVLTGKASLVRRLFQFLWEKLICCSAVAAAAAASTKPQPYRRLESSPSTSIRLGVGGGGGDCELEEAAAMMDAEAATTAEPDKVVLKISLLGDCQIGKTSFVIKYVGDSEDERRCVQMTGVNLMDKILLVKGAKIAFSIWDVGGDQQFTDQVALACKDAAAIMIMFDLTSRCTLNSVIGWYQEARKWNQTAIPILIGTKFDDFILLPLDVQWTIVNQARTYAHAMKATLFFSSAKHNINVNKIFKFITAKCFNLPWTIERNLTIGEPIIDF